MNIKKINVDKILIMFLLSHISIWTFIPSISNNNLPLDTIEHLAWASDLQLGYGKHPPMVAWVLEFFYQIFGKQDWAYYFLSQLFVGLAFYVIFLFSQGFLKNKIYSLISIFLLEGIYFYNFTTPEFNVNVCQIPFWTLTIYFCWKGIEENNTIDWLLFGVFASLGILSKYLFIYLLFAIDIFFIYLIIKKKFNSKSLISLASFFIILIPHLLWLVDNDFVTITYAMHRTGFGEEGFFTAHLINPIIFFGKQVLIIIPFLIMFIFLISKIKVKINLKDKKLIFLLSITLLPIILMFLTSIIMGIKIRTMWMTPFYLFFGVLFLYLFQKIITLKYIRYFSSIFLFLFFISPFTYFYISVTKSDKRTDYPGKEISKIVQKKWNDNFINEIELVSGDEWHGGNLSYHLESRPKWDNILENNTQNPLLKADSGFVIIGDIDILKKICSGIFFETYKQGICMIGKRK